MKKLHTSMKKDKWVAYNILYEDGKQIGKPYKAGHGSTLKEAEQVTTAYNKSWNKNSGNGHYVAELVEIRKVKKR